MMPDDDDDSDDEGDEDDEDDEDDPRLQIQKIEPITSFA